MVRLCIISLSFLIARRVISRRVALVRYCHCHRLFRPVTYRVPVCHTHLRPRPSHRDRSTIHLLTTHRPSREYERLVQTNCRTRHRICWSPSPSPSIMVMMAMAQAGVTLTHGPITRLITSKVQLSRNTNGLVQVASHLMSQSHRPAISSKATLGYLKVRALVN